MANLSKEHKEDDARPRRNTVGASQGQNEKGKRHNLISALLGNCMCAPFPSQVRELSQSTQFVELHGLRFIGLGALADELSPKERVYDTLEQLTTRTERLVSIGYLLTTPSTSTTSFQLVSKTAETIPLDVWDQNYTDNDRNMSKQNRTIVSHTKRKQFQSVRDIFVRSLRSQKANPNIGNNKYLAGVSAHNLGVIEVLAGRPHEAIAYFREAICLKEAAFGRQDPEVALSWDELGIQLFARGDFEAALASFREAHNVRRTIESSSHPSVAMVLNNMACCYFQMGDLRAALKSLQEADDIQQKAIGSSAQSDLDVLHVAIVICNCGYLKLALKEYDEARSLLEEALLIQQSVLDDNHRAVRDTLSNIEFSNVFHC